MSLVGERDELREEILREYYFVEDKVVKYDQLLITVKSFSAAAYGVLAAAYVSSDLKVNSRDFLLVIAAAAIIFWYIEAQWKSYQRIAMDLGDALATSLASTKPYSIRYMNQDGSIAIERLYKSPELGRAYKHGFNSGRKFLRFWGSVRLVNVSLPHLPVLVTTSLLWLFVS